MSNQETSLGEIALWRKDTYFRGYLGVMEEGVLVKYPMSMFKNTKESSKALFNGSIQVQDEDDSYVKLAFLNVYRNEGQGEHQLYGYVNVKEEYADLYPELNYLVKLTKCDTGEGETRPCLKGTVHEIPAKGSGTTKTESVIPRLRKPSGSKSTAPESTAVDDIEQLF